MAQSAPPLPERGASSFTPLPQAQFEFRGVVGERVAANVRQWLLRAPESNPGLLEMFRVRDRQPRPQLVPWAGEFVGKYLISAVQTLRMTRDPELEGLVGKVVAEFLATQADDGYLGPFPKDLRLLKNWDLWGHYHAIQALVLWHERTGDATALDGARRAADLVCRTYLDTGRRVFDAGDPEMNMSILTGMAMLYRLTGEPRYRRMIEEVEKDWERAGDYLRSGLDGREFFQSPRPRWESLHSLQGLYELWRLTGEAPYRESFEHHWRSIRRWDVRNTGGFSSGEQATGNPYAPSAIETCCTVAWMTLTADYLRLTGDPHAADDLEWATFNGGLGAQHPSGRWWTYNTPMDGVREASAHTIVFQSRAGTPELNCCSVNAPRVLGLLSEWAVLRATNALVLNWLGPMSVTLPWSGNSHLGLVVESGYPVEGECVVRFDAVPPAEFELRLRIPAWASGATARLDDEPALEVRPGSYLSVRRRWQTTDRLRLRLPVDRLRFLPGANEADGKVSVFRGPLLLAYDQRFDTRDEAQLPLLDLRHATATTLAPPRSSSGLSPSPWLVCRVATADGRPLHLVDFANAGATGTRYRSWLAATAPLPPPARMQLPRDGAHHPPGLTQFRWRGRRASSNPSTATSTHRSYRLEFSDTEDFAAIRLSTNATDTDRLSFDTAILASRTDTLPATRYWRVISVGNHGETPPEGPPTRFTLDASARPQDLPPEPHPGPRGEWILHSLRGDEAPRFGTVSSASFEARDAEGTTVNGRDQRLVYDLPLWPEEDFTVAVRVRIRELPKGHLGQVFSAWTAVGDDPLRLVLDGTRLFARIEAGGSVSTPGTPVETGRWYRLAAVKRGATLEFFIDGHRAGSAPAPEWSTSQSRQVALGGNPRYSGNEFLAATFADFALLSRAASAEEIPDLP